MAERVRLASGRLRLELAPEAGGSVAAFVLDRTEGPFHLMRPAPADMTSAREAAAFPMTPFANRVRDGRFAFRGRDVSLAPNMAPQRHPLHGQGWLAAWAVDSASAEAAEVVYRHSPGEWPWSYEARQSFALDAAGLHYALSVANTSADPMPAGLGLHPYFPADRDTVFTASAAHVWTVDEEVMPLERQPAVGRYDLRGRRIEAAGLDNGYEAWSGEADVRWPAQGVRMRMNASANARRLQVYAPPRGGFFCAEPVTHANDALSAPDDRWPELGLTVLNPGERVEMTVRFDVFQD